METKFDFPFGATLDNVESYILEEDVAFVEHVMKISPSAVEAFLIDNIEEFADYLGIENRL